MNPHVWGPATWLFIHSVPLDYPDNPSPEQMVDTKQFFILLGDTLPCTTCSINYKKHLQKHPLTAPILGSKRRLFNWTVDLHNEVNKMTGKPTLTYEDGYKVTLQKYNSKSPKKMFTQRCLLVAVLVLLVLLYLRSKP